MPNVFFHRKRKLIRNDTGDTVVWLILKFRHNIVFVGIGPLLLVLNIVLVMVMP